MTNCFKDKRKYFDKKLVGSFGHGGSSCDLYSHNNDSVNKSERKPSVVIYTTKPNNKILPEELDASIVTLSLFIWLL